MAGHSHWAGIKHKKEIQDAKRSQLFSKLTRLITLAAKKGPNPELNPELKMAIERAKEANLPQENIERAIKRGIGESGGPKLESIILEGIISGKATVVIEGITDNRNRTLSEIRQIFEKFGGKLVSGSVLWQYQRKGCLIVDFSEHEKSFSKEELELLAIEAGAEDTLWRGEILEVYTKPEELEKTKKILEEKGIKIKEKELVWVPREEVQIENEEEKKKLREFFEALDSHSDVQDIYFNISNL